MRITVKRLDEIVEDLRPEERPRAAALSEVRRREFIAGRAALRSLLDAPAAIPSDDRGAPVLPAGWVGSISHTRDRVAAIVAPDEGWRVGVDLERRAGLRYDIARRVLRPSELARLPADREAHVLLAFSIKEAIYKAIDPYERRYVGFQEVELVFDRDRDRVETIITELPLEIEARFEIVDDHWLSTARARRR